MISFVSDLHRNLAHLASLIITLNLHTKCVELNFEQSCHSKLEENQTGIKLSK